MGSPDIQDNVLERILDGREKPTNLPFPLLKSITENFSEKHEIGKGGFGIVYKGVIANRAVAVKRIMNCHTIDDKLFYGEVNSLLTINHKNVVRFLGYCSNTEETAIQNKQLPSGYIYAEIRERLLCFEYICNGSLNKHITDELRGLEWSTRFQIIRGICEGLYHLHNESGIIHMDLKPENVLLDNQMVPKVTDFGLSRPDMHSRTMSPNRFVSLGYCAPEYQHYGTMSTKSDIYSLGVIIIELVTGRKDIPDRTSNVRRILEKKIFRVHRRWGYRLKKSGKHTPLGYQRIAKCIEIGLVCQETDPRKRPSISKIIDDLSKVETANVPDNNGNNSSVGQISPYFEEDMLAIEPLELRFPFEPNKQISCSVLLTNGTETHIAFIIDTMNPLCHCIQPEKGTLPPQSGCKVKITLQTKYKAPQYMQHARHDEFTVRSTKVNEGLSEEYISEDIFSKDDVDEVNLGVVYETPQLIEEPKDLSYQEVSTANMEPGRTISEVLIPGSSKLLDIHPRELRFTFQPNKLMQCSLKVTNKTDESVAFRLMKKSRTYIECLPLQGIAPPRSTNTHKVTIREQAKLPEETELDLILESRSLSGDNFFEEAKRLVHQVTLRAEIRPPPIQVDPPECRFPDVQEEVSTTLTTPQSTFANRRMSQQKRPLPTHHPSA